MSYNESSKKATLKYAKNNLKRVPLDIKKTDYVVLKTYCTDRNIGINTFIKQAIQEKLARETKESSNEN